ncbi:MAG: hypothetical protein A2014_00395 [Spirochaetes bacterium GWF1_49_6]|nr:MAG: hypothetical protein A2014_00395 [Spirochaetes bacterium GWF1_49_6]
MFYTFSKLSGEFLEAPYNKNKTDKSSVNKKGKLYWEGITLEITENIFSMDSELMILSLGASPQSFFPPSASLVYFPKMFFSLNMMTRIKLVFHPAQFFEWGFGYARNVNAAYDSNPSASLPNLTYSGDIVHSYLADQSVSHGIIGNIGIRIPLCNFSSFFGSADWIIGINDLTKVFQGKYQKLLKNIIVDAGVDLKLGFFGLSFYYQWCFDNVLESDYQVYEGIGAGIKIWL